MNQAWMAKRVLHSGRIRHKNFLQALALLRSYMLHGLNVNDIDTVRIPASYAVSKIIVVN